jgi:hypothetical protein
MDSTTNIDFQSRVAPWMKACFSSQIAADTVERNHRFLEEALELVQACGCTQSEAHQLVDYVYGRPVGEVRQEVGGVMVTLAALCLAQHISMHECGEAELARIWTCIDKIRAKQATKPKNSPLPEPSAAVPAQTLGTCDLSVLQPCPHCDKPIEVGPDGRARKSDFFSNGPAGDIDFRPDPDQLGGPEKWREACRLYRSRCSAHDCEDMGRLHAYIERGLLIVVRPLGMFEPHWPEGLRSGEHYRVSCDDKGHSGGSWLQVLIAPADGDVYVSMQDWENIPKGEPDPFPSVRIRTMAGGGRNDRTRQALLWLAEAIRLDTEESKR